MKLFIDVHSIPRPERSGLISMLVMYVLLTGAGDVINAPYMTSAGSWKDLLCWVLPCSLFSFPEKPEQDVSEPRETLTPLMFGNGKGKPICACHIDIRPAGHAVEHFHFPQELTCESEYPPPDLRVWHTLQKTISVPVGTTAGLDPDAFPIQVNFGDGTHRDLSMGDSYRFHCTTADDSAP